MGFEVQFATHSMAESHCFVKVVVLGLCSLPHLMGFEKQFATHSMAESHCSLD